MNVKFNWTFGKSVSIIIWAKNSSRWVRAAHRYFAQRFENDVIQLLFESVDFPDRVNSKCVAEGDFWLVLTVDFEFQKEKMTVECPKLLLSLHFAARCSTDAHYALLLQRVVRRIDYSCECWLNVIVVWRMATSTSKKDGSLFLATTSARTLVTCLNTRSFSFSQFQSAWKQMLFR